MLRLLARLFFFGAVGCVVYLTVYRFEHPTLTETQLFLALWPVWLVTAALILLTLLAEAERNLRKSRLLSATSRTQHIDDPPVMP